MTKREAVKRARIEIGAIYRVAAGRGSVTWGFQTVSPVSTRMHIENAIGTYREAVKARTEWIKTRAAELAGDPS